MDNRLDLGEKVPKWWPKWWTTLKTLESGTNLKIINVRAYWYFILIYATTTPKG
jgi:hypothetical protein